MKKLPSNHATHGAFDSQITGRVVKKTTGMHKRQVSPAISNGGVFSFISFRLIGSMVILPRK